MLKNKLKNKKKGFTLIELIVVLAVLAIIALIAIPNFNRIRENSKIKSDERSADLIEKAVLTLVLDGEDITKNGTYTYDGKNVIPKKGATVAGDAPEGLIIQTVLDGAKVQQAKDATGDLDGLFDIFVTDIASADPKVNVAVGAYNSDGVTTVTPSSPTR